MTTAETNPAMTARFFVETNLAVHALDADPSRQERAFAKRPSQRGRARFIVF